ncbi:hypothetical protein [Mesorhizobium sp. M7A.F.Ca.ET.027.03.2.1]|uniref:hypothetical protein n=1 Tax=Mesorhizobium sp. M7A.F.Ca.ET.027.03.2.1 TaxID=2496656 RepID=UPI000FCC2986|nr:hypothetical protein [Mesorhizobium sp. M7A.F.Ca.ET.027.03.2.1]RVD66076.1 hypothetical protein EN750_05050 [Mesorhizobium sp. M7A.F.Ca.ET.027.03.2.1]
MGVEPQRVLPDHVEGFFAELRSGSDDARSACGLARAFRRRSWYASTVSPLRSTFSSLASEYRTRSRWTSSASPSARVHLLATAAQRARGVGYVVFVRMRLDMQLPTNAEHGSIFRALLFSRPDGPPGIARDGRQLRLQPSFHSSGKR